MESTMSLLLSLEFVLGIVVVVQCHDPFIVRFWTSCEEHPVSKSLWDYTRLSSDRATEGIFDGRQKRRVKFWTVPEGRIRKRFDPITFWNQLSYSEVYQDVQENLDSRKHIKVELTKVEFCRDDGQDCSVRMDKTSLTMTKRHTETSARCFWKWRLVVGSPWTSWFRKNFWANLTKRGLSSSYFRSIKILKFTIRFFHSCDIATFFGFPDDVFFPTWHHFFMKSSAALIPPLGSHPSDVLRISTFSRPNLGIVFFGLPHVASPSWGTPSVPSSSSSQIPFGPRLLSSSPLPDQNCLKKHWVLQNLDLT